MSERITRRAFLSHEVLTGVVQKWLGESAPLPNDPTHEALTNYFRSPMYSYPLLQEMPWDMLVEEAKKKGIDVAGKSKNEIARAIFMMTEGAAHGTTA